MDGKNKANNKFNKPNDNNESLVDPKSSNHRCCAERRLLSMWEAKARKHGLRPHQITTWIRRKAGPDLVVWRTLSDGQLGCAAPCVLCRGEIVRYDFRVHCTVSDGSWYSGKLDEDGAPPCKPTAGQMRLMFGRSPYSPNSHRHRNAFHRMHATAQATLPAPPQLPREPPCAAVKPPCVQPKSLVPSQLTRGQRPPLLLHFVHTPPPPRHLSSAVPEDAAQPQRPSCPRLTYGAGSLHWCSSGWCASTSVTRKLCWCVVEGSAGQPQGGRHVQSTCAAVQMGVCTCLGPSTPHTQHFDWVIVSQPVCLEPVFVCHVWIAASCCCTDMHVWSSAVC